MSPSALFPFALFPLAVLPLAGCEPAEPDEEQRAPVEQQALDVGGVEVTQHDSGFTVRAQLHEPLADAVDEGPFSDAVCTGEEIEGCTFFVCDLQTPPTPPPESLNAGLLTILRGETVPTVPYGDDGRYAIVEAEGEVLFQNGASIELRAAGGSDLGAFQIFLAAPTPLRVTSPALGSVSVKVIDPLVVSWSGESTGTVTATLVESPNPVRRAICRGDSTAGSLRFPPEIVGRFLVGEGRLEVSGGNAQSVVVDETRTVTFAAHTPSTSATGSAARFNVFFLAP